MPNTVGMVLCVDGYRFVFSDESIMLIELGVKVDVS